MPAGDPLKAPLFPRGSRARAVSGSLVMSCVLDLLDPLGPCAAHSGGAGAADLRAAAVMLVIGGDVPDRSVEPNRVVLGADPGELGVEGGRVGDTGEVRPVALQTQFGG
jgi:hypothetical protein